MSKDEKTLEVSAEVIETINNLSTSQITAEDAAREALENIIKSLHMSSTKRTLTEDEIKSLSQMVDALIKMKKEDRELAQKYIMMSDADLIKAAKKATKILKKKKI